MLNVAICGGSGYTGAELLRILTFHPEVEITAVTAEKSAGKKITDVFPHLHHYGSLTYEPLEREKLCSRADLFFMALPHAASQDAVDFFVRKKKRVIDLSADFRLRDPKVYEEWYRVPHRYHATLKKSTYGLPELYRKEIARADLVANPGCYPTGALIAIYPALKHSFIDPDSIVIDSKSGTSGAGRQSDVSFFYCEVNEGLKAYGIGKHRHTPEIEQELTALTGRSITVTFTPHLIPLDRGILSTVYAKLVRKAETTEVLEAYRDAYAKEPFVRILDEGSFPNVKHVRGTNFCEVGITVNTRTSTLIIVSTIDNLVKGASGQAVQNMNIMMGFEETAALTTPALFP
jgi:N-acetyl-gamma-glutamyl-phosphate reductase